MNAEALRVIYTPPVLFKLPSETYHFRRVLHTHTEQALHDLWQQASAFATIASDVCSISNLRVSNQPDRLIIALNALARAAEPLELSWLEHQVNHRQQLLLLIAFAIYGRLRWLRTLHYPHLQEQQQQEQQMQHEEDAEEQHSSDSVPSCHAENRSLDDALWLLQQGEPSGSAWCSLSSTRSPVEQEEANKFDTESTKLIRQEAEIEISWLKQDINRLQHAIDCSMSASSDVCTRAPSVHEVHLLTQKVNDAAVHSYSEAAHHQRVQRMFEARDAVPDETTHRSSYRLRQMVHANRLYDNSSNSSGTP